MELLYLVIPLVTGILLGYVLREKVHVNLGRVAFGAIIVLIFSLGFSIGSNNELLGVMPNIGLNALVILSLAIFFSVVFTKAARKMVKME